MNKHHPRVLLHAPEPSIPTWSRRNSWFVGGESIYSLLAKFAQLNALTNKDLCELFVKPTKPHGPIPKYPSIDLRVSDRFYEAKLSNALGVGEADFRAAFVQYRFPNSLALSSKSFVWCSKCARYGFHSIVFQLNSQVTCPLHHTPLESRCNTCRAQIPYSLTAKGQSLFRCVACEADIAVGLRTCRSTLGTKLLSGKNHLEFIDLFAFLDALPTVINACKQSLGRPHIPLAISKPDLQRRSQTYRQFIDEVLTSLSPKPSLEHLPVRKPTAVFVSNAVVTSPQQRDLNLDLEAAQYLYRCVRRHIVRRFCRGHERCIHAAQKALWWDLNGEDTVNFCPTAAAFLRWRMHWEGCRIPSMLDNSSKPRTYTGLVGWLCADAPVGSHLWTNQLDSWIKNQLIVYALFDSFSQWQQLISLDAAWIAWDKTAATTFRQRYWACCGRGTDFEPARFFAEDTFQVPELPPHCNRLHFRRTRQLLKSIQR